MSERARAIVVGASAGALEALSALLPALPANFPLPVVVVVHVPADRHSTLAQLLARKCAMQVVEAEDKLPLLGGTVYVAPPNYHLLVEAHGALALSSDEPVLFSRPSIDVLFESAADAYGPALIAALLTGANSDGAQGLAAVAAAGGAALVQDPRSAFAPAMPEAAIKLVPNAKVMSLAEMSAYLQEAGSVV